MALIASPRARGIRRRASDQIDGPRTEPVKRHVTAHRTNKQRSIESVQSCQEGVMTFIAEDLAVMTNPDGNCLQTIASRLRKHLQKIARRRVPTTYQELARALALTPPHRIHQVTEALEHLMAEDARPTARSSPPSPSARRGAASRPQGSLIAPGGSDALPVMRRDSRLRPSMRGSSTPRSRSGRQRQPMARAGKEAWAFARIRRRIRPG